MANDRTASPPATNERTVRVYCAGKIRKGHRWPPMPFAGHGGDWERANTEGIKLSLGLRGISVIYVGPFAYSCDHGCSHGPTSHGNALSLRDSGYAMGEYSCQEASGDRPADGFHRDNDRLAVFWRSLRQIDRADLVIARPEFDSYGTLVEIGWAAKANKAIIVDLNGQPNDVSSELWFAAEAHGYDDYVFEDIAKAMLCYGPEQWGPHAKDAAEDIQRPDPQESLCSSPIEVSLYKAMRALGLKPTPQVSIGRYRADFVIGELVIECDGHNYHSSREQRTHDASRDRAITAAGYRVVRFTGTEIHADAARCARDVLLLVDPSVAHQPSQSNTQSTTDST